MKRTISLFSVIVCGLMFFASCSKSPDVASYIPREAIMVMDVDVNTLFKKADVAHIDNIAIAKMARQELRKENPQMGKLVDDIIADPTSCGLDLREDVTVYFDASFGGSCLAAMHKEGKFADFLTRFAKDSDSEISIEEKDGYRLADIEGRHVAFNDEVALFIFGFGHNEDQIAKAMHLQKEESMASSTNFGDYWRNRGEVSMWMDFGNLLDIAESMGGINALSESGMPAEYWDMLKEGSFAMNMIFDKGAVRFVVETQGIDSRIMKDYEQPFNANLLDYMPEETYVAATMAMPVDKMLEALEESDEMDLDDEVAGGKSIREVVKAFGGSIAISLFDIVQEEKVLPLIAVAADVRDGAVVREVLASAGLQQKGGAYVIPDFGIGEISITLTDDVVVIANTVEVTERAMAGGYGNGMKAIASKAKKGNYFYANLNLGLYPVAFTDLLPQDAVHVLANFLDYTEAYNKDSNHAEWVVYLQDKRRNSLLSMLHFVDDNLVDLTSLAETLGGQDECEIVTDTLYVESDGDMHID